MLIIFLFCYHHTYKLHLGKLSQHLRREEKNRIYKSTRDNKRGSEAKSETTTIEILGTVAKIKRKAKRERSYRENKAEEISAVQMTLLVHSGSLFFFIGSLLFSFVFLRRPPGGKFVLL